MILYTCAVQKHGATSPLIKHPCGVAAKALDDAGQPYEIKVVGGFKKLPLSRRGKRQEIEQLTGQQDVRYSCSTTAQLSQAQQRSRPGRKDTR